MKLVSYIITHHNCPVAVREKASFTDRQREFILRKMHAEEQISEAVILQTCNRLEFYLYARKNFDCKKFIADLIRQVRPEAADIWSKHTRWLTGIDSVRHLFEVAAGLDSQMVGENQVLSQIKSAYTESIDCRMSKLVFHRLFHNAFRVGKVVRTDTNINCGAVSIGLAAVELAKKKLDLPGATAMITGAGQNAELVAKYLLKGGLSNLIIANRSKQRAKNMAARLGTGRVITLGDIAGQLNAIDLLIASTASAELIVTYDLAANALAQRKKRLLIIDIAVPRDIDPQIGRFKCVRLYNIDDLNEQISCNKARRSREIPKALRIVSESAEKFARWYESLNIVPVISQLTKKGIDMAHNEAERYAKDFSRDSSDKLKLFAESLVRKVLHGPISFLKGSENDESSTEQLAAADLINKMFLSQNKRK